MNGGCASIYVAPVALDVASLLNDDAGIDTIQTRLYGVVASLICMLHVKPWRRMEERHETPRKRLRASDSGPADCEGFELT